MFKTLRNAWAIKEIRNKILFTIFILLVFRVGSVIPVPFINVDALKTNSNDFFNYLSILTGGGLQYGAIFALSVTPYINSSIIVQLLTVVFTKLQEWSKEGEEGQKKLAQLIRYVTIGLAVIQGIAYYIYLERSNFLTVKGTFAEIYAGIVLVAVFTAGSALVMWLGEQIDAKGIGNGISMILFAGIISRAPDAAAYLWGMIGLKQYVQVAAVIIIFLAVILFVVWMTAAERRIAVQYAKRVVGNKMYGGQNTHIPIKVNMSGVMPIIFASSILMLPTMILSFMGTPKAGFQESFAKVLNLFSVQGIFYAVVYFFLIIGFAYFYATIQFNPVEMANNLRKNGGAIPGIRPGQPTTDFISKILSRITLLGALFLSVVAILPIIVGNVGKINIALGGTSMLILVGVALDTVRSLESQMMMRHYKGFLD
ncbi:MAG: preprotein translocase subunit SecY [Clostridia bacterium]|nr:preprotein translocase subunit SecY [Clostridia bacterium]